MCNALADCWGLPALCDCQVDGRVFFLWGLGATRYLSQAQDIQAHKKRNSFWGVGFNPPRVLWAAMAVYKGSNCVPTKSVVCRAP